MTSRLRNRRVGLRGIGAWALLLAVGATAAEPHLVEVVGAYPIQESMRGKLKPRDEAIRKALWEGVSRVALELIGEQADPDPAETLPASGPEAASGAGTDSTARFRKLFGKEILPYTRSFRILEDRGERPVLFADEPGVRSEYLVVVEVIVDVERVTAELARAGLVEVRSGSGPSESMTIELVGLGQHAGLRRVMEVLRHELGVTRIETLEFSPARQILRLETVFGPTEFAARLGRLESADLILAPDEIDQEGRRLRVLAQWFPPVPVDQGASSPAGAAPAAPPRP